MHTDRSASSNPQPAGLRCPAHDRALELGAALGIAILGAFLATTYKDKLTDVVGGHLPAAAMDTAKDSAGGGLAVAEQIAKNPQGAQQAQTLVDAVHESFAHAIAHTSLIGAIIMAAGTLIVVAVLPGRKATGKHRQEKPVAAEADRDEECADPVR
jgi:hypothetical protein